MKFRMEQPSSTPQRIICVSRWNTPSKPYPSFPAPYRATSRGFQLAGMIAVAALAAAPLFAQKKASGFPEDWSHHHVVFSNPGTLPEASRKGSFDSWLKVVANPRFTFQQQKRGSRPPFHRWRKDQGTKEAPLQRDWSASLGIAGVAPDMFPAKWTFSATATPSCSDYVVFPVNAAGAAGSQPNIVGFQNLYVNGGDTGVCPGTAPTVLFSYYVGAGTVQTSPFLGGVAGEVAYVESVTGDGASVGSIFHVLTGAGTGASNGTVAAPVAPGAGNSALDVAITMSGFVSVTRSSPFYDYTNDVAYVGDDSGVLHKFTPVFNGPPAEVTTGGWPATVSTQTGKILTAPVFDSGTGLVYVGDSQGYLYSVNASGTSVQSGLLGSGAGIVDSPLLDPSAETLYVFVGDNAGGTGSAVFAFNVSAGITAGSTGSTAILGTQSATIPVYDGMFDNAYYTSSTNAGNLYVCGNAGGNPTLYAIPISYSSGPVLGSVVTGPPLASSNIACSPVTEFYNSNTSTDWLFAAVSSTSCGASSGTTAGGCVMSFNITTALTGSTPGPWTPSTTYATDAEIVDTSGNLQECTGGGCGEAGNQSGTATPAWTTTTTTDGTGTNASATGTITANSAASGATVTIGSLTLTASAPTYASSPILIALEPNGPTTLTVGTTMYDFRLSQGNCTVGINCIEDVSTLAMDQTGLITAINGTSCWDPCVSINPSVTATAGTTDTVIITAITPGTGANSDPLATSDPAAVQFNGGAFPSTTLGAGTGTLGTNGSNTPPNFQYWSGSAAASTSTLASNIAGAGAGNSAGVTLTYVSGNTFLATGTGANAGPAGNSVAIGGTLTGFSWNPTGFLAGGTSPLMWTYQSASNGQTTAPQPTGSSGIVVDNDGTGAGEASIYFGTLSGTGATNSGVKMTQSGLN